MTQPFLHRTTVAIFDLCGPFETRTFRFCHRSVDRSLRALGGLDRSEAATDALWDTDEDRFRRVGGVVAESEASKAGDFLAEVESALGSVSFLGVGSGLGLLEPTKKELCRWQYRSPFKATAA